MIPPEADQPRPGVILLQAFHLTADFTDQAAEQKRNRCGCPQARAVLGACRLAAPDAFAHEGEAWQQVAVAVESERPPAVPAWEPAADPRAAAEHLAELLRQRLLAESLANLAADLYGGSLPASSWPAWRKRRRVQAAVRELRAGEALAVTALFPQGTQHTAAAQGGGKDTGSRGRRATYRYRQTGQVPWRPAAWVAPACGRARAGQDNPVPADRCERGPGGVPCAVPHLRGSARAPGAQSGVPAGRAGDEAVCRGYGEPAEVERAMRQYGPELAPFHIIEGSARLTVGQVRGKALQLMAKHKAPRCFVVVDYLQRWAATRREFTDFRHVVSGLVSELRELALRLIAPCWLSPARTGRGRGVRHSPA